MKPVRYFVHASEFTQEVYDKMVDMVGKLDYSFEELDQKLQTAYIANHGRKRGHTSDYALICLPTGLINLDFCSYGHLEFYLDRYEWINLGVSGHSVAEHLFIRHLEE